MTNVLIILTLCFHRFVTISIFRVVCQEVNNFKYGIKLNQNIENSIFYHCRVVLVTLPIHNRLYKTFLFASRRKSLLGDFHSQSFRLNCSSILPIFEGVSNNLNAVGILSNRFPEILFGFLLPISRKMFSISSSVDACKFISSVSYFGTKSKG